MKHTKSQSGMVGHIELLLVLVVVGVIGLGAWRVMSMNKNDEASNAPKASINEQEVADVLPTDLTDIKPIDEIRTAANAELNGATITGIELEIEHGKPVYVVHLSDGSRLFFDAVSGTKVTASDDKDDEIDDSVSLPSGFVAGVTIQQAIDTAKKEQPNATVKKVEMETEEGVVVYSVRFTNGARVDVNATDGSIVRIKQAKQSESDDNSGSGNQSGSSSGSGSHDSSDDDNADHDQNEDSSSSNDDEEDDSSSGGHHNDNDNDDEDDDNSGSANSGSGSGN